MSFFPDYVGMMQKQKKSLLDFLSTLDEKYGKVGFGAPVSAEECSRWEQEHGIRIPDDYKAWLEFSGKTVFPTVPMQLLPPSEFQIGDGYVIIGTRGDAPIAFRVNNPEQDYFLFDGTERKKLGVMETIFRYWMYDMKDIIRKNTVHLLQPQIDEQAAIMAEKEVLARNSESGVKAALEYHFAAEVISYLKQWGTYPIVPFQGNQNDNPLLISGRDDEGYCQWKMIPQTEPVDFAAIERKLGFPIHESIKELLSCYFYFQLEGKTEHYTIWIDGLSPKTDIARMIPDFFDQKGYCEETDWIPDTHFYRIGSGIIGGDDSYIYEVDNATGEVYAFEYMDHRYHKIENSIKDLLLHIKPVYG